MPTAVTDQYSGTRRLAADGMGRVTAVYAATWTESYAYDAFGNVNVADTPIADDTVGDRDIDRTLIRRAGRTSYEHDAAGRSTTRLAIHLGYRGSADQGRGAGRYDLAVRIRPARPAGQQDQDGH